MFKLNNDMLLNPRGVYLDMEEIKPQLETARYAINGLLFELNQVENGGYFSMEYINEKLTTVKDACTQIAKTRGFIKE